MTTEFQINFLIDCPYKIQFNLLLNIIVYLFLLQRQKLIKKQSQPREDHNFENARRT